MKINVHPAKQFNPALTHLLNSVSTWKHRSYYDIVDALYLAFFAPDKASEDALGIARQMRIQPDFNKVDDYFADLNQQRNKVARSHGSEFFTPTALCEHAAVQLQGMLACQYRHEKSTPLVVEPSAGTGMMMMSFIRSLATSTFLPEVEFVANDINGTSLKALMINYELARERLSLKPLVILQGSALETLDPYLGKASVVLGNPPFHNQSLYGTESVELPSMYTSPISFSLQSGDITKCPDGINLKTKAVKRKKNVDLANAFVELGLKLLKTDGVLGMYVPDGILSNAKYKEFRANILEQKALLSVQSMPTESFLHSSTSVKVSLLLLSNCSIFESCFMAQIEKIGWDTRLRETESEMNLSEVQLLRDDIITAFKTRKRTRVSLVTAGCEPESMAA